MGEQSFVVVGQPVPWKRTQGSGKRRYTHPKYGAWKAQIQHAAREARIQSVDGPVCMEVEARVENRRFADVDNLAKAVLDALEGIAYANDRQVCELRAVRVLDRDAPGLYVTIREVDMPLGTDDSSARVGAPGCGHCEQGMIIEGSRSRHCPRCLDAAMQAMIEREGL